jgi:O-antigen/teichoic acid export membrane protein
MLVSIGAVSLFSILNGFSMIIIQNVDIIMINSMVGLSDTGIYSICFFFGVVVSLPARSIIKIANIITSQAWKDNDLNLIRDLYHKSCLTLFIIGSLLFIGLWANINNIFHIIGQQYSAGKWVIFFIGLSSLIDMITGANGAIIGTSKYYKVQTFFLVILVILLVITNLLLIPKFGITGASIGSAISLSVLNLLRYLFLLFKYQLQPFNIQFMYVAFIGAGSYFISTLLPPSSNYIVDIFARSSLLVILFCTPVYLLRISIDLNAKADEILKKLKIIK